MLIAIACLLLASGINADQIDGAYFEKILNVDNTTLRLTGASLLRYWGFKAYVGAFYLEEGSTIKERNWPSTAT